jgi:hypothetical protein
MLEIGDTRFSSEGCDTLAEVETVRQLGRVDDRQCRAVDHDPVFADRLAHAERDHRLDDMGDRVACLVGEVTVKKVEVPFVDHHHEIATERVRGFPGRFVRIGEQGSLLIARRSRLRDHAHRWRDPLRHIEIPD